jgi:hypothetical protein
VKTEAGRRLLAILPGPDEHGNGVAWEQRIEAIEAEASRLDVRVLTDALIEVEESKLSVACLTDECDHEDDDPRHMDDSLGCGDAAAIAAAYAIEADRGQKVQSVGGEGRTDHREHQPK